MTVPERAVGVDFNERLVAISQEAHALGYYEVAFHTLSAALQCADHAQDAERAGAVALLAAEQLRLIDVREPTHRLSSASAAERGHPGVYATLILQATTKHQMLTRHGEDDERPTQGSGM